MYLKRNKKKYNYMQDKIKKQLQLIIEEADMHSSYIISMLDDPANNNNSEFTTIDEIIGFIKRLGVNDEEAADICYNQLAQTTEKHNCMKFYNDTQNESSKRISNKLSNWCTGLQVINPK